MPTLDPATQYATDVIAGREVAGRLVRLACARHLDDVKQQVAKGLEWKPDEASPVYEFFETILCLPEETDAKDDASPEASPFILTPFQKFIVGSLFGWYVAGSGKRRFSKAYIETGKGSGKSPLAAGIALYMLIADGTRGAQIFTAAVTLDQAKIPFADAEKMVKASAWLSEHVDQKRNNLAVLSSGNFMRPISAEKRGLDGKRVKCAIVEELHEHQTPIVAQKIIAGIKGQPNPLIFMPTNAGYDRESICWHYHEYSREVLEGTTTDETWFAYVCHMDPCEPCYAAGKRQPTDGCPDCDDWKTEGPHWLKANPNLGVSLPWNYLREQVRVAVGMPSSRNIVKRLNFCEWTDQVTVWIPPEQWAACKGAATAASLVGRECYIGIDLSDHIDLTSIVLVFTTPGEPALKVDLGTSPVGDQQVARSVELNVSFDLLSFFWLPEAILRKRAAEDKIDYPLWKELGHLKTTDGSNINLDDLYDFVVNDLAVKYRVLGIGIDPNRASYLSSRLKGHFGDELVIDVPQGFRTMSEPMKLCEAVIEGKRLRHDGNRCFAWNIANVQKEENRWNDIRPVKINQRKRIDGAMAMLDALHLFIKNPPPPPVDWRVKSMAELL